MRNLDMSKRKQKSHNKKKSAADVISFETEFDKIIKKAQQGNVLNALELTKQLLIQFPEKL